MKHKNAKTLSKPKPKRTEPKVHTIMLPEELPSHGAYKPAEIVSEDAPNIVRNWQRFLVVGCIHSTRACPVAVQSIVDFILRWKPGVVVVNGDLLDLEAFMGAVKDKDGVEPVADDVDEGIRILNRIAVACQEVGAHLVFNEGNHEARLWRAVSGNNEMAAFAAFKIQSELRRVVEMAGGTYVEYRGIWTGYLLGDNCLITHGSVYNVNAPRDMATAYVHKGLSVVIFNHTHSPGWAIGNRDDAPMGLNAGHLQRRAHPLASYADSRLKTFSWMPGCAYGEFSQNVCVPSLYVHPLGLEGQPWRLPA
jgi:predicted phosphodiesterase